MISLNKACEIAYKKRDEFDAVFEVGIDQAFDRITYWTIGFDYIDPDSYDSPLALQLSGRTLCICLDKETGEEIEGEEFDLGETPPGHEVPVPDDYYRVPWYEENN